MTSGARRVILKQTVLHRRVLCQRVAVLLAMVPMSNFDHAHEQYRTVEQMHHLLSLYQMLPHLAGQGSCYWRIITLRGVLKATPRLAAVKSRDKMSPAHEVETAEFSAWAAGASGSMPDIRYGLCALHASLYWGPNLGPGI
jgi:hypothetical protein